MTAKTVFYASVGPEFACYDIDVAGAALHKREAVTLPVNVQYAWQHPSKPYLYVVSSTAAPAGSSATLTSPTPSASIPRPARCRRTASRGCCRRARSTPASTGPATIC